MPTVCAVILTYNRCDLLIKCLDSIDRQTRPCDKIIVVDNASTDGTRDVLGQEWESRVTVVALKENVGAAGGFNIGMRCAYRTGSEFVWVMDDDVFTEPDTLERLLAGDTRLKAHGIQAPFLVSNALSPTGLSTNTPDIDLRPNSLAYGAWPVFLRYSLVPVWRSTFVSILLPRSTLSRFGLPIADMFMWGEDMEYTTRITEESPGYLVGDSHVVHVRVLAGAPNIETESDARRISCFYHHKRNQMYMFRRFKKGSPVRHFAHQIRLALKLAGTGRFRKAALVAAGTLHGLVFDPRIESADEI
ncbi:glycosyltransferase family 2 protein [Microvirga arabica]|nr:glycosyltransferase family 2 protein [Microvirga arabica]